MSFRLTRITLGIVRRKVSLQSRGSGFCAHVLCNSDHVRPNKPKFRSFTTAGRYDSQILRENTSISTAGLDLNMLKDSENQGLARLIEAYRVYGHKKADINPLYQHAESECEELNPEKYGLTLNTKVTLADGQSAFVSDLICNLERIFCGPLSIETGHLVSALEKDFIAEAFIEEKVADVSLQEKKQIAELMIKSEAFDHFVHAKFKTVKRYGGEGAESAAVFADEVFRNVAKSSIDDVIIGMPHRGRLNLLAMQLKLPPEVMFRKMKGLSEFPDDMLSIATGDVLSHLTSSCDLDYDGANVHVTMLPCPSHLEAVNPVAIGKCRARQQTISRDPVDTSKALCFLMHGDAAVAGQGIVAECFNMSNLAHFSVGGTVHLIVNNQLGFTTPHLKGRSSMYASDIAKSVGCPVLHVNGDCPEDVARAARIALKYRNTFHRDIMVDLLCYRQWGHNEMDDPSFTQPIMYRNIASRQSPPEVYVTELVNTGIISPDDVAGWKSTVQEEMNQHLKNADSYKVPVTYLQKQWSGLKYGSGSQISEWDTGFPIENLRFIAKASVKVPETLDMHSRLVKMYADSRKEKISSMAPVDWATAEAMSFGSLLQQGFDIRLCGQDVGRGTFSQRHASVICQDSEEAHIPLNHLNDEQQAKIEVVSSLLSEEAVLGFEYGMSVESPRRLNIWEAQFGDFFNGAQIIIDTFISSGEAKWLIQSGLVVLLPHGYDGMGPEHSSCRIERFLQLTNSQENGIDGDGVNMHFCHPTTPAQYFHLLRRQMIRNYRKPLIIASPKTLLRLPAASSPLSDMAPGTSFQPILADSSIKDKSKVSTILFCSGKHFYALIEERERLNLNPTVAVIRLEELCPFPASCLQKEIASYPNVEKFVWSQEEPRNMGAWNFVNTRFENIVGVKLRYAGRPVLPAPAVGIGLINKKQMEDIVSDAFKF